MSDLDYSASGELAKLLQQSSGGNLGYDPNRVPTIDEVLGVAPTTLTSPSYGIEAPPMPTYGINNISPLDRLSIKTLYPFNAESQIESLKRKGYKPFTDFETGRLMLEMPDGSISPVDPSYSEAYDAAGIKGILHELPSETLENIDLALPLKYTSLLKGALMGAGAETIRGGLQYLDGGFNSGDFAASMGLSTALGSTLGTITQRSALAKQKAVELAKKGMGQAGDKMSWLANYFDFNNPRNIAKDMQLPDSYFNEANKDAVKEAAKTLFPSPEFQSIQANWSIPKRAKEAIKQREALNKGINEFFETTGKKLQMQGDEILGQGFEDVEQLLKNPNVPPEVRKQLKKVYLNAATPIRKMTVSDARETTQYLDDLAKRGVKDPRELAPTVDAYRKLSDDYRAGYQGVIARDGGEEGAEALRKQQVVHQLIPFVEALANAASKKTSTVPGPGKIFAGAINSRLRRVWAMLAIHSADPVKRAFAVDQLKKLGKLGTGSGMFGKAMSLALKGATVTGKATGKGIIKARNPYIDYQTKALMEQATEPNPPSLVLGELPPLPEDGVSQPGNTSMGKVIAVDGEELFNPGETLQGGSLNDLPTLTPTPSPTPFDATASSLKKKQDVAMNIDPSNITRETYNAPEVKNGLLDALEKVESNNNPKAVSHAGAQGAYQLMPETGKELHRKHKKEYGLADKYDPFDREQARVLADIYIQEQLERFGDMRLAFAAYNWGQGNVRRLIKRVGNDWNKIYPELPKETRKHNDSIFRQYSLLMTEGGGNGV